MHIHTRRLVLASILVFLLYIPLHAQNSSYVLDNRDYLLIPKSVEFVEVLSQELFLKTGYSLYVAVVDETPSLLDSKESYSQDRGLDKLDRGVLRRTAYKNQLTYNLSKPYALIVFMKHDSKIDILTSDTQNTSSVFDKDKVYYEYMVPLLPRERDDILDPQRISAIVLNGYSEAADMIAQHFNVQLTHNIPADERGGREFVRFCMYAMLLVLFGIFGFVYITRKLRR